MSLTEDIQQIEEVDPPAVTPAEPTSTARVLLVWDAPNLDMGLGSILGGRPTAAHRPRFDALGRWLLARTADLSAAWPDFSLEPEATVFTNIAPGSADVVRPWVDVHLSSSMHIDSNDPKSRPRLSSTKLGFVNNPGY